MDLLITHRRRKYIVETKIWRGDIRYQMGKKQLAAYLKLEGETQGYYVVFDHRKTPEPQVETETIQGVRLRELRDLCLTRTTFIAIRKITYGVIREKQGVLAKKPPISRYFIGNLVYHFISLLGCIRRATGQNPYLGMSAWFLFCATGINLDFR